VPSPKWPRDPRGDPVLAHQQQPAIAGHLPTSKTRGHRALLDGGKAAAFRVADGSLRRGGRCLHSTHIDIGPNSSLQFLP
jgi:hypothetical protein